MILTGASSYSQTFYPQSNFSYSFQTDRMDNFVLTFTGPTGAAGAFKFDSGKIYDTNGNFFSSYATGAPLKFDFAYNTGRYSTWINDDLKSTNRAFYTGSGQMLTGFSMSGYRDIELGVSLYGQRPGLYFSPLETEDGVNFTGYVRVTGAAASLYSITPNNGSGFTITSNPFTSGNYRISGQNFGSGYEIPTTFLFDFGSHQETLSTVINPDNSPTGYITIGSDASVTGDFGFGDIQYQDFSVVSSWSAAANFETYVRFLYRSGYTTIYGTGIGTGNYSGYISGSGYLTGTSITGYISQGYYNQLHSTISTGFAPIMATGEGSIFYYATGLVTYDYFIPAYAYEQDTDGAGNPGGLYSYCTGYLSGTLTGTVGPGSGKYVFNSTITGFPVLYNNQYFTGGFDGGNGTGNFGYYGDNNGSADYYWNGDIVTRTIYTGQVSYTGYAYGEYTVAGSGGFTGQVESGYIYSTDTGLITGFNLFTGELYIQTGEFAYVTGNYYDYRLNGHRNTGYLRKSADSISEGVYQIGARITYDRNIPWGVSDYIEFTARISGGGYESTTTVYPDGYSL